MSDEASIDLASWRDFLENRSSAWVLLLSNAFPLLGVLFWGWSTFAIVAIYWAENVVLGLINVLKMLVCANPLEISAQESKWHFTQHAAKLFFVPFFTVHYGGFCAVHGVFVFALLGGEGGVFSGDPFSNWHSKLDVLRETGAVWGIAALGASHLYSFFSNFLWGGEFRRVTVPELMIRPYGRIVVLHIAIILGAIATMALGSPIGVLIVLILGKTALDLALHLKEHRGLTQQENVENVDDLSRDF